MSAALEAYEYRTGDVVEFRERYLNRDGMLAEVGEKARVIDATGGKIDVSIRNDAAQLASVLPPLLRLVDKGREEATITTRAGRLAIVGRGGQFSFPAAQAAVARVGSRVSVEGGGCRVWFDLPPEEDDSAAKALYAALIALLSEDGTVTQRVRLGCTGLSAHGVHSAPVRTASTRSRTF